MNEAKIAGKKPTVVELEPGTYWWCSCGLSENQPFCDSSHKMTDFSPIKIEVEQKHKYWLCTCKQSNEKPFCDGAHKQL